MGADACAARVQRAKRQMSRRKGALTGEAQEQEQDPASHPARGGRVTGRPGACFGMQRAARRPRWGALSSTAAHSATMQRRTSGAMAQTRLLLVAPRRSSSSRESGRASSATWRA
ncbi:hypothetical protein MTO96_011947 [Rhipicephalus appendiculatus]